MLEIMPESQGKILWLRAAGRRTDRDYREVFSPRLEVRGGQGSGVRGQGKAKFTAFICQFLYNET